MFLCVTLACENPPRIILCEGIPFFTSWSIKALTMEKSEKTQSLYKAETKKLHIPNLCTVHINFTDVLFSDALLIPASSSSASGLNP